MTKLDKIIDFIKDPKYVVFWMKTDTDYFELSGVVEEDDEMKAYFAGWVGNFVDLFNVDFNDIRVFEESAEWDNWKKKESSNGKD